jgi:hypothetical protein
VLDAELARHSQYKDLLVGLELGPVLAFAEPLLATTPLSGRQLRAAIASEFPDLPADALAYACRCKIPLVQIPPRGVWGKALQVTLTPLDDWIGHRRRGPAPRLSDMARRYFAAFGPASVADLASWCRLTGMREVVDAIRAELRPFRQDHGPELLDLPDAPRPDPDTPAPVRFLPEYDNSLLSHADRRRFSPGGNPFTRAAGPIKGSVLVDGLAQAVWHIDDDRRAGTATLTVEHLRLPRQARADVEAEAARMLAVWRPGASTHLRLSPLPG